MTPFCHFLNYGTVLKIEFAWKAAKILPPMTVFGMSKMSHRKTDQFWLKKGQSIAPFCHFFKIQTNVESNITWEAAKILPPTISLGSVYSGL